MSKQALYSLLAALTLVAFGVLMAVRTQPQSFGVRVAVATLAGICLGAALMYAGKARSA